jgi:GDP-4-dehydro-6-deoxy-D-mannose reductase
LDYSINSLGARYIIEALIAEGINTRVILIGSAAEYGIVSPDENPIKENRALCPVTVYGLSKAFQTQLGIYFAQNSNIEILIARMFNLQAPGLSEQLFIGRMEKQITAFLRGEIKEIVAGNLDSQRDYISADKAIEQLNMIAKKGKSGEVYHIASGQPIKMKELLHKMLFDARIDPLKIKEDIGAIGKIDYDVPVIYADMTKTNKLKTL